MKFHTPSVFGLIMICSLGVFAQSDSENPVSYCSPKGHYLCVKITAKEVYNDGAHGKWSEHWHRMSYIGEACVEEHGRRKGKVLEAVFSPPHYIAMTVVNIGGLIRYGFSSKKRKEAMRIENEMVTFADPNQNKDPLWPTK